MFIKFNKIKYKKLDSSLGRKGFFREGNTEGLMLAPALIGLAIVSIFPLFYLIYVSFFDFTLFVDNPIFCGFNNWIRVLKNPVFWESWGRTLIFASSGLVIEVILGVGIALLLYNISIASNFFLTMLMIPVFVAPVVAGLLARFMLNSTYGLYAYVFKLLGNKTEIFGNTTTAMTAIVLVDVWEWTPLIMIIIFAGLQSMDIQPMEAASIDGANYWQKIRYIIFPTLLPTIGIAALIRSMDILRYVDVIKILTGGGPANATKISGYHLIEAAFNHQDFGGAAVQGFVMIAVIVLIGKVFVNIMAKGGNI